MSADGAESIDDDELLYRRIPAAPGYYDPTIDPNPSPPIKRFLAARVNL